MPAHNARRRTGGRCGHGIGGGGAAHADENWANGKRYRLTRLTELGFNPIVDRHGTMGINNKGQVVYGLIDDDLYRAWVWLPEPDYSLPTDLAAFGPGLFLLDDVMVPPILSPGDTIARDINENGAVVGHSNFTEDSTLNLLEDGQASVWDLITRQKTAAGPGECWVRWTAGYALNDAIPPEIVGETGVIGPCCGDTLFNCPNCPGTCTVILRGFREVLGNDIVQNDLLLPFSTADATFTFGRDIKPGDASGSRAVGFIDCREPIAGTTNAQCDAPEECSEEWEALTWTGPGTGARLNQFGPAERTAYGINANEQIVGWNRTDDDDCPRITSFWSSRTATPLRLGDLLPSGDESRAFAINTQFFPDAVGENESASTAFLWKAKKSSPTALSDWEAIELNGVHTASCNVTLNLLQAHDINDKGWIAAIAREPSPSTTRHAVLLTPLGHCPGDVDGDRQHTARDIQLAAASFGPCEDGRICWADMNFDCEVDIDDIVEIVCSWGDIECQLTTPDNVPAMTAEFLIEQFDDDPTMLGIWLLALQIAQQQGCVPEVP